MRGDGHARSRPTARAGRVEGRRADAVQHESPEQRRGGVAGAAPLSQASHQPEGELEEAHRRARQRHVGIAMRPLTDQPLPRRGQPLHQPGIAFE